MVKLPAPVREFGATRRAARCSLLFGLVTGLLGLGYALTEVQDSFQLDYHAYYFAGRAVLQGEPFVGTAIHDGTFLTIKEYVYPPITALVFSIYGWLPYWQIGYVVNLALLVFVFYGIARLTIRYIEQQGVTLERIDRWLIVGFCLFSGHTIIALYRGNIDPAVLLMLAVGFLAMERGNETKGGLLWGVAALFKLFPAFLGIWMLYRRTYRAIAVAVVTGLGSLLLGVVIFGVDAHVEFVDFVLNERSRKAAFEGGLDPTFLTITLRRPLSQFLSLSGNQLLVLSTLLIVPFVLYIYHEAETQLDHTVAFFATMVALLITLVPTTLNYVLYLYFPAVALLFLTDDRLTTSLFVAGFVLVNLPVFPQHIALLVNALPLPVAVGSAIENGTRAVMTYASIPLCGFLLLFAGCLRFVRLPAPVADETHEDPSGTPGGD